MNIYLQQFSLELAEGVHAVLVWDQAGFTNRAYADYDDLRCAAIDAWQKAALDPETIKSVCRVPYVERNN